MTIAFCSDLYAGNVMVDDTIITMRVDTIVMKRNLPTTANTLSVNYYSPEEYAKKTGLPSLAEADCDTIYYIYRDTVVLAKGVTATEEEVLIDSTDCHADDKVRWAVKTNLLWDALLAPNVEVEVPIDRQRRWTIMGEWWNPWYTVSVSVFTYCHKKTDQERRLSQFC